MSIANEIQRIQQAKADIADAIVAKGGEVSGTIDTYAQAIAELPSGNLRVVEGEMTLASESKNLVIYYTNDTPPISASAFEVDYVSKQQNDKSFGSTIQYLDSIGRESRAPVYWSASGVITCSTALQDSGIGIKDNRVVFSSSRSFITGTYKYKLFFES